MWPEVNALRPCSASRNSFDSSDCSKQYFHFTFSAVSDVSNETMKLCTHFAHTVKQVFV